MLSYFYRFDVLIRVDGRKGFEYATFGRVFFRKLRENIHFEKYPDTCGLGLRLENTIYNVLLNNKTFNFRDIKKHPSIQFSPLIDAVLSLIKYKINMVGFRFTDCIVKINANWRKSGENDYVKKNLHATELLNRNHGDQNNSERGRPIIVADYKIGSNHQINAREIKRFAKRTFLC